MPLTYKVIGMDCADEVAVLKDALKGVVPIERVTFDVINGTLTADVASDADALLRAAVAETGMRAEPWTGAAGDPGAAQRHRRTIACVVSGLTLAAALAIQGFWHGTPKALLGAEGGEGGYALPWAAVIACVASVVAGAWYVAPRAWYALRSFRADMNLLMMIAVVGAGVIGEWLEAATVAFLFALSIMLEAWSVGRARRAVEALLDLAPDAVHVQEPDGSMRDLPVAEVRPGMRFRVRPGERIPLDGRVLAGASSVDQSPITGESAAIAKALGDDVFAGTVNGEAVLDIESTKAAGDTTLAHIIRLVGSAQSKRSSAERWVDRFARIYTPVILALAILVMTVPPLMGWGTWQEWIYRGLILLVIGCPCALVISTPVTIVAAIASAARRGVLVKGGESIEAPASLRVIALDKTGTLTQGRPRVRAIFPLSGHSERELLAIAAALENQSTHPLALAVVAEARTRGIAPLTATEVAAVPGKGVTGIVDGKPHWLGSRRYLVERRQESADVGERLQELAKNGDTVVVIGAQDHVCGYLALTDTVRPDAVTVVQRLHAAGIQRVAMLTGDNQGTADAVAKQTGVDQVHAQLLPADKVAVIQTLVQEYGRVGMVGDGINDAPALASATVGIAMGAAGSDAAIETADVALMSDDLSAIPWLIEHSRRTLRIIRQNVAIALGVKAVFLALTLLGQASMWAAIAADMGASLVVIVNGMRLLRGMRGDH